MQSVYEAQASTDTPRNSQRFSQVFILLRWHIAWEEQLSWETAPVMAIWLQVVAQTFWVVSHMQAESPLQVDGVVYWMAHCSVHFKVMMFQLQLELVWHLATVIAIAHLVAHIKFLVSQWQLVSPAQSAEVDRVVHPAVQAPVLTS
jgi:hypothetical protein